MALVWERPAAPAVSQAACSDPSALGWFSPQTSCNAKWIRWKPSKTLTLKSYIVLQNDLIAQQTCTPEFQLLLHLRVTTSNQPRTDLTQRRRLTSTNPGIEHDRALGFPVTKDKAPHGAHFVGMWMVCCKIVTRHGLECSRPSQGPVDGGGVGGRLSLQVRHLLHQGSWAGKEQTQNYFTSSDPRPDIYFQPSTWHSFWHILCTVYLASILAVYRYGVQVQAPSSSIRSWRYGLRVQASPTASGAGRRKELHLCQNLETLTWQVGKKQTRLFFWGILLSLAC